MGINVENVYQSKSNFLKAADLPDGKQVPVVIESCELIKMDDKDKVNVHFKGKEKTLVLNKTNSNAISHVYGPDTDAWIGKSIFLFTALVEYQGNSVPAVRVSVPLQTASPDERIPGFDAPSQQAQQQQQAPQQNSQQQQAPQSPEHERQISQDFDDDIPF